MLKEIRIRHGFTLQEVADKSRLSRVTVDAAERGRIVSVVSASRIASALSELSGQTYTVENLGIQTKQKDT
jgi:transcriptional regulator with XRE-family HTH domain